MTSVKKWISSFIKYVIGVYVKIVSKTYKKNTNDRNKLYMAIRKTCIRKCCCLLRCFPFGVERNAPFVSKDRSASFLRAKQPTKGTTALRTSNLLYVLVLIHTALHFTHFTNLKK